MKPVAPLILVAALAVGAPALAQGFLGDVMKAAKQEAERQAQEKIRQQMRQGAQPAARPAAPPPPSSAPARTPTAAPATASRPVAQPAVATALVGPSAITRISSRPNEMWLNGRRGAKFEPMEGPAQIIATNPYLGSENFLFAKMSDIACTPDGGLMIGGEGFEAGDIITLGWWRVAPDGAVTRVYTNAWGEKSPLPGPYNFTVARDGSLLVSFRDAIWRVRDGRAVLLAGAEEIEGDLDGPGRAARLKDPKAPLEDPQGNVWFADQGGCVLRRIDPAGNVTTVIGRERTICGELPVGERVTITSLSWDPVNNELVGAGSTIVAKPAHDMHITVWRISTDGQARRVYYTTKNGRSPIGQNTDHIWAAAVDSRGRIYVGSHLMGSRARRQIMRLDETTKKMVVLTGNGYGAFADPYMRPGREEDPYDGPLARANYRETNRMCFDPNDVLFSLDEHFVRRLNPDGTVRSWIY